MISIFYQKVFSVFGLISHGHPEIIETERLKGVITHDIAMLESDMDTKLANKQTTYRSQVSN